MVGKSISQPTVLKARENPFRSDRIAEFRYRITAHDFGQLLQPLLLQSTYQYAIMGPEGTGKTILLEDLSERLPRKEWVWIKEEDPPLQKWKAAVLLFRKKDPRVLLVDGGELLPRFCWSRFWLRRQKLIATAHRFHPRLQLLYRTEYLPEVAVSMVSQLLGRRLTPTERQKIYDWGDCGGNVREILRMCYHMRL